jgi:hypothetical protein
MQACDFETLKDFILSKNTYLHNGYANAFKDDATKRILAVKGSDYISLLPDDTKGNYCYLRNDTIMQFTPQLQEPLTDAGTQRLSFLDNIIISLVAIVHDADALKLVENLRNSCMVYEALNVQPLSANWNREQVITEELAGMKTEDVAAALKRLKDEIIVKLNLRVSQLFIPSSCMADVCKTC